MLVVQRRAGESVQIGDNVLVTVTDIGQGRVRIGVTAPPEVMIVRTELMGRGRPDEPARVPDPVGDRVRALRAGRRVPVG